MLSFRCYVSLDGEDEVQRWYDRQTPCVRGATSAVLEALGRRPPDLWRRKPYGILRGSSCLGLGEIRIEEPRGVHYRILGCFDDPAVAFILLYAFAKDEDQAYEISCSVAQSRRNDLEQDHAFTRTCRFASPGWRYDGSRVSRFLYGA